MPFKRSQLSCKFIGECVPDFYYLSENGGLRGQERIDRNGILYAVQCDVGPFQSTAEHRLAFLFLQMNDNVAALDKLRPLLHEKIHCPVEALYDVYGDIDFILELVGTDEDIVHSVSTLERGLAKDLRKMKVHKVTEVYRHWGLQATGDSQDSYAWLIHPENYQAIRAFMYCFPSKIFDESAERGMFPTRLSEALNYDLYDENPAPLTDERLKAMDLVDRIYFTESGACVIGLLCRCGDYYRLNKVANNIAKVVERQYGAQKTTYLVGQIPHLEPHRAPLIPSISNDRAHEFEDAYQLLDPLTSVNPKDYSVVGDFCRYDDQARRRLGELCDKIAASARVEDPKEAKSFLLQAAAGSGKTFLITELAKSLDGVEFLRIPLDKCGETEWTGFLQAAQATKGRVLCFLDEINKHKELTWPMVPLRSVLEANKKRPNREPIVWVLAGSEGDSIADLIANLESRPENGRDVVSRLDVKEEIPGTTIGDRLLIAISAVLARAQERGKHIHRIEKRALHYMMTATSDPTARDIAKLAKRGVESMEIGHNNVRFEDLFTGADQAAKEEYMRQYPRSARLATLFLRIVGDNA